MDAAPLHSSTLDQLNHAIVCMTSPEWNALIQDATATERQQAKAAMLRVQQARLALANAALTNIVDSLKANEAGLIKGQNAVQSALDDLTTVTSVLKAVTTLVNIVAKIVPLV